MRRVIIMGAGGRDFHNFNTVYRDDPNTDVVAFTAAQIPGIAGRVYPASLAGSKYPDGIRVCSEDDLDALVRNEDVDEVVLAYSDLAHEEVMHKAARVLAAGADFRLIGPKASMLSAAKPVVAVCAVRTGCGKSQTTRRIASILIDRGLRVAVVRHPMPYGDLERMRVQRFVSLRDIDEAAPTIEEREEYEPLVAMGVSVYAGVDYGAILQSAEAECDALIWDGGNNDFPFFAPDLMVTVVDALRPGHEVRYHPGEVNLRLADVVVINKVDGAGPGAVGAIVANVESLNPAATVVRAESPVRLDPGPSLARARVLVVEDGPTLTHGGAAYGAGLVAARAAGVAEVVDPRPYAVGSIAASFARYPNLGAVLPAMGYSGRQRAELEQTITNTPCDVVLAGTPVDLARVLPGVRTPIRRVTYELAEIGTPNLDDVLAPFARKWRERALARQ